MAARSELTIARVKGALTASVALPSPTALVAASAPIDNPADVFKSGLTGGRRRLDWQEEAWRHYDRVGEFKFYVQFVATSCSRARLVASAIDPDTGMPTGSIDEKDTDGQRFADMVKGMAGGPLGQSQVVRRTAELLKVPGELYTAIVVRPNPFKSGETVEQWVPLTLDDIKPNPRDTNSVIIDLPDGKTHEFNARNGDGMFRTWIPHAKKASEADSAARSCADSLREIVRTTEKIENADESRIMQNGLLMIPQEASLPAVQSPVSGGKPGDPAAPPAPRGPTSTQLQQLIVNVAAKGRRDPRSPESLMPIVGSAPGEHIDKIKHIQFGKDISGDEITKRDAAIRRLAMGLDMSPERLTGLGDSNHWSSRGIADDDVQLHLSPVLEVICQSYYDNVFRRMLTKEGIDPDKYILWYDTSRLTADPDLTDEHKDAYQGGAITADALVRGLGLPEDSLYDFDTPDGVKKFMRDAITKDPTLITQPGMAQLLSQLFGGLAGIDIPEQQPALPSGGQPPVAMQAETPAESGDEPVTENTTPRARVASVATAEPISMAVDWGTMRALDMAGKRRVKTNDRDQRDRLRDVEPHEYYRYMPPVTGGEVPSLIRGWDTGLDDVAGRYGLDADEIRSQVAQRARHYLTSPVVDAEVG